jgi:hypothetical protein
MRNNLNLVLDHCLSRIADGETIEQCLGDYPQLRSELAPLLRVAARLAALPQVNPAESFRRASSHRLMARLKDTAGTPRRESWSNPVSVIGAALRPGLKRWLHSKAPVVVAVAVLMVVCLGLAIYWQNSTLTRPLGQAAECSLTQLKGSVQVQSLNSTNWQAASATQKITTGDRIKTNSGSVAILTFADGSTVKLEPETEIRLTKNEYTGDHTLKISLNQSSGQLWSHLRHPSRSSSELKIQTPTTDITADNDSFLVQVDDTGLTRVTSYSGAVAVSAPNGSIMLAADQQIEVAPDQAAQLPQSISDSVNRLVCSAGPSSVIKVIDPDGSGSGFGSDGSDFNQITRSNLQQSARGQTVEIRQPASGLYILVIRTAEASASVAIRVIHQGSTIAEYSPSLTANQANGWIIKFELERDNQSGAAFRVLSLETLGEQYPEPVVTTAGAQTTTAAGKGDSNSPQTESGSTEWPNEPTPEKTLFPSPVKPEPGATGDPRPTPAADRVITPVPANAEVEKNTPKTSTPARSEKVTPTPNETKPTTPAGTVSPPADKTPDGGSPSKSPAAGNTANATTSGSGHNR